MKQKYKDMMDAYNEKHVAEDYAQWKAEIELRRFNFSDKKKPGRKRSWKYTKATGKQERDSKGEIDWSKRIPGHIEWVIRLAGGNEYKEGIRPPPLEPGKEEPVDVIWREWSKKTTKEKQVKLVQEEADDDDLGDLNVDNLPSSAPPSWFESAIKFVVLRKLQGPRSLRKKCDEDFWPHVP
ncbi:hypothetical protein B0T26DRAFT_679179 [Lasiosphaeria miniovina]|uniref:Uncharacterized protein n=1 Tax=Lasiosphaeria miniovina TaxID=1954250 RepID=A0AA40A5V9_9PEZI|nr:uncharacterized protein B0T26DRAFT_679179 [Lasiosphaeria miniovina]KAK0709812.1 hypothetical protein B0T26DRAFT_679179 [Lasiosphaeria miniovina]